MRRRDFLAASSAAAALAACGGKATPPLPPGTFSGANDTLGHRLRQPDFPPPTETRKLAVAIVGGGVAGLSAAWKLARAGCDDYLLLEMEAEAGGNSRAGKNEVSAYPLGAHYLPLPPREARATRALLAELGVLRGNPDAVHPDYDERYLCHAPQERLYKDGYWQEGLWPTLGVPAAERAQYTRFQEFIQQLRQQRDGSGRRPFALPLALSSRDPQRLALDRSNLRDWLLAQGYTAPGLHWLADYAGRAA
jgi:glycine/D-amino acid oxidase-like deaminating enzyme